MCKPTFRTPCARIIGIVRQRRIFCLLIVRNTTRCMFSRRRGGGLQAIPARGRGYILFIITHGRDATKLRVLHFIGPGRCHNNSAIV